MITITGLMLQGIPVISPTTQEQILIGKFFARVDASIRLTEKQLGLLKNLKKSLLDKMFV